jgi:hypothetical protein
MNLTSKRQCTSEKPVAYSPAAMMLSLRKMKFKLNRWLANSLAHTNQYLSGLKKATRKHGALYIEKKTF